MHVCESARFSLIRSSSYFFPLFSVPHIKHRQRQWWRWWRRCAAIEIKCRNRCHRDARTYVCFVHVINSKVVYEYMAFLAAFNHQKQKQRWQPMIHNSIYFCWKDDYCTVLKWLLELIEENIIIHRQTTTATATAVNTFMNVKYWHWNLISVKHWMNNNNNSNHRKEVAYRLSHRGLLVHLRRWRHYWKVRTTRSTPWNRIHRNQLCAFFISFFFVKMFKCVIKSSIPFNLTLKCIFDVPKYIGRIFSQSSFL